MITKDIAPSTTRSFDGISLVYDCYGYGKPLVLFVHGWTCCRSYWTPQLEYFSDKYAVAALDLPGHGDSGIGTRHCWGVETFALDVMACVKALGAEEVILVGHSMGGAVVLEAARHLEDIVAGVVLIDTFVIDYGGLSAEAIRQIVSPFEENFVSAMTALVEQTSTAVTPSALSKKLICEMSAADPIWALPVWGDLLAWTPQAAFDELHVPIHVVNGSLISMQARQRCAPFVTETIIPGAGHFLQMEDPLGFNRVLEGVLSEFD